MVETYGHYEPNHYVSAYKIKYTTDGSTWNWYGGGEGELLQGNTDGSNSVINYTHDLIASVVRIYPKEASRNLPAMRFEIYFTESMEEFHRR